MYAHIACWSKSRKCLSVSLFENGIFSVSWVSFPPLGIGSSVLQAFSKLKISVKFDTNEWETELLLLLHNTFVLSSLVNILWGYLCHVVLNASLCITVSTE